MGGRTIFIAACLLAMPLCASPAQAATAGDSRVVERLEISSGDGGRLDLALLLRPSPASYTLERVASGSGMLILKLPGYSSQVPPDITAGDGKVVVRVGEDGEGTWVEIPAAGLEIGAVRFDGDRLTLTLGRRALVAESAPSSAPADDAATSYRVGTGDLLAISVFGHEDLSKTVRVVSNGTINFPLLGDVLVGGKTPHEISAVLGKMLARDFVVNPQVLVGVTEYLSQPVNVIGEVRRPDKYYLKGPTSLIDILSEAGGLSENSGAEIVITHSAAADGKAQGPRQIRIPTEALFAGTNAALNVQVMAGDVINVLQAAFFYIRGEVMRPGQYPLRTDTTMQKALSLAGGFSQWADEKDIQIIRAGDGGKKISINVRKIAKGQAPDVKIEPEDIIVVSRRLL